MLAVQAVLGGYKKTAFFFLPTLSHLQIDVYMGKNLAQFSEHDSLQFSHLANSDSTICGQILFSHKLGIQ